MDEYLLAKHTLAEGMKLLAKPVHTDIIIHERRGYRITIEKLDETTTVEAVRDLLKEEKANEH